MPSLSADTPMQSVAPARSEAHLVPLTGDWALWRDFAVRSAGFPVSGLNAFGGESEGERLREVARDADFNEAITWQSRDVLSTVVTKLADGSPVAGAKRRRREEAL